MYAIRSYYENRNKLGTGSEYQRLLDAGITIIPDEGGRDLFVHLSAVKGMSFGDSLEEGQAVEFNVRNNFV